MKTNIYKFLTSAVYMLLGLALILWANKVGDMVCTILAVAAAAIGIGKIIGYFCTSVESRLAKDTNSFAEGCVLLVVAGFLAFDAIMFEMIIPFVLGLMITYKGLEGFQNAINLKKFGHSLPKGILIASLVITVVGLLTMINPFATAKVLFMILGLGLFLSGLADFVADIVFTKKLRDIKAEREAMEEVEEVVENVTE